MMKDPDLILNMKETTNKEAVNRKHQPEATTSTSTGSHQANKKNLKTPVTNSNNLNKSIEISTVRRSSSEINVIEGFNLSDKISVLKCNNQIKELHTVLRDKLIFYIVEINKYYMLLTTDYIETPPTVILNFIPIDW